MGITGYLRHLLNRMSRRRDQAAVVDDKGIRRRLAGGKVEAVAWDDLVEVAIRTTSGGPWKDDVFFLLAARGGSGCAVPQSDPAAEQLLHRLQILPGFDNKRFIEAMACTEERLFICWRRDGAPNDGSEEAEPRG